MRSNIRTHQFGKSSQIFLNENDNPRPIEISCRYHTGSNCLNYCHEFKCFRLLCEQCIEQHLDHHKKTSLPVDSIKSLKKVRQFCIDKLNRLLEQLCLSMNDLKEPKNPQQIIEEVNFKFGKVKEIMFEIIEAELSRFQEQIRNKVNESFSTIKNLEDIHANLAKIIQQLAESKTIIVEGTREMSSAMKTVLEMNEQVYKESFGKQVQIYSQKLAMTQFDIGINQGAFRNSVNECLKITKSQYKPDYDTGKSKLGNSSMEAHHEFPREERQPVLSRKMVGDYDSSVKQLDSGLVPKLESPIPLLYFFQNFSPYLHLLTVPHSPSSSFPSWQKKTLIGNDQYQIPQFHASIISAKGYIFLSGGIIFDEDENQTKSSLMSKYSLKEGKFKEDFTIVAPRSSHSMVEADGYIFILGGFGQHGQDGVVFSYDFEQVNIQSGELKSLPSSKFGGANISCLFYPYIIKASQEGVQAYSLMNNSWSLVSVHGSHYNFYRECGFSKLSEGSLMVYGGYNLKSQQGVDECFVWQLESSNSPGLNKKQLSLSIRKLKSTRLPKKGGFWNNPGITKNGVLLALQNIEQGQQVIQSMRDIIIFNGETWSNIKPDN